MNQIAHSLNQIVHLETRIDDHRSIFISSESGASLADEADAARFPSGGLFYVRERDDRLPVEGGSYVLANAASLEAAQRLVNLFKRAATPASAPIITEKAELDA